MSVENESLKIKQLAQKKVMDLLAQREHSESELRQKLRSSLGRSSAFETPDDLEEVVDDVIRFAKEKNFLGDSTELAIRTAESLHKKHKGILYINSYLQEKGLPEVETDADLELAKAMHLVKTKNSENKLSREDQAKMARFLSSRGFDEETVRKVLYEKL